MIYWQHYRNPQHCLLACSERLPSPCSGDGAAGEDHRFDDDRVDAMRWERNGFGAFGKERRPDGLDRSPSRDFVIKSKPIEYSLPWIGVKVGRLKINQRRIPDGRVNKSVIK